MPVIVRNVVTPDRGAKLVRLVLANSSGRVEAVDIPAAAGAAILALVKADRAIAAQALVNKDASDED